MVFRDNYVLDLGIAFFKQFRRPYKFEDLGEFLISGGMEKFRKLDFAMLREQKDCQYSLKGVKLEAPVMRPPKIVCVGLNYRDHAREQQKEVPDKPLLFCKAANVVIGEGETIQLPEGQSEKVDYEVELAVVIGKPGFKIPREEAREHVFGYTIMNDVTARDLQASERQWFRAKSFHTFAPLGPVVVSPDTVDTKNLHLELRLNGQVMQSGNTGDMVFDPEFLIEYISNCFPLEPGDIIATGTPAGVGVHRNPPTFLRPGDEIEAEIEGIGVLHNTVA